MSRADYVEPTDEEIAKRFPGRYQRVPIGLRAGLIRYVDHGIAPGGFLTAVICNDLLEATGRADEESRAAFFEIVGWFYNEAPSTCWKSRAAMDAWIVKHAPPKGYAGPIEEGMRFLWEGDKAHARCVVRVTGFGQVDGERTIRGIVEQTGPTTISRVGEENSNEESRFREAVAPFGGKL